MLQPTPNHHRTLFALCIAALAGLVIGACEAPGSSSDEFDLEAWKQDNWNRPRSDSLTTVRAALTPASTCEDALVQLRVKLIREMEESLEANMASSIAALGQECWDDYYWGDVMVMDSGSWAGADAGGYAPQADAGPTEDPDEASDYSTTNTQVADVDEADFIKNDGGFIYILADGRLQIIDAWPPEQAHHLGSVEVDGQPKRMFVHKDRAVVYASLDSYDVADEWGYYPYGYFSECTYGYDCEFTGDGQPLKISVFDISDKTAPQLERTISFSGSYLNARRIDDAIFSVVHFADFVRQVDGVRYQPDGMSSWELCGSDLTEAQVAEAYEQLRAHNTALIEEADLSTNLPIVQDTRYVDGVPIVDDGLLAGCENFYVEDAGDGGALLSLVSFDIDALEPLKSTTIVGKPGAVYASRQSLYVGVRHYASEMSSWYYDDPEPGAEATTLHKFALDPASGTTTYIGSGLAKGRVLNQFAMDEHDGYLRIATTTGHVPSPDVHSTVSVLAESAEGLSVVGVLDNLAPTEDIRSVRFNGDTGFVVTFKKTDPLFVIDLATPTAPAVRGELKIPGFSTYMHMMDDRHILAMGYDADDQGSFAWFQGVLLQIFDVSDLANPRLMHKEVIGTRGSTSEATTNHLAFNYFPARDLLAVPMTICEDSSGGGSYGEHMSFSGLLVYRVDLESGFEQLGGVPHAPEQDFEEPEWEWESYSACSSWWTQSASIVKRSVFMEDWVYSVASDAIKIASIDDLEHPVVELPLLD